jgi:hypothetical protein
MILATKRKVTVTSCSGIENIHTDLTILTDMGKNENIATARFPLDMSIAETKAPFAIQ